MLKFILIVMCLCAALAYGKRQGSLDSCSIIEMKKPCWIVVKKEGAAPKSFALYTKDEEGNLVLKRKGNLLNSKDKTFNMTFDEQGLVDLVVIFFDNKEKPTAIDYLEIVVTKTGEKEESYDRQP